MKTKEELKEWFWDMYNSCYVVKHDDYPNVEFLFYDENFNRQCKLKTILGEEIIYPTQIIGECLFEIDWEYNIFWVSTNTIITYIESVYYDDIDYLIQDWLDEYDKFKGLTPTITSYFISVLELNRNTNKLTIFKK